MLTTIPLAPSCLTETWLLTVGSQGPAAVVVGNPHDPSCWPGTRDLATTISPAICPEGYTSACDITDSSQRKEGETVWACCPSNFRCDGGTWSCVIGTRGPTKTYTVTDTNSNGITITTKITTDRGVNAHSIRVAFRSSDIAPPPTSTNQSTGADTTPAITAAAPSITSTSITPPESRYTGLSQGAWIGIGVTIGVSGLALLAAIVWMIKKRLGKSRHPVAELSTQPGSRAQLDLRTELDSRTQPSELYGVPVHPR
ncbi:putative serine family S28 [Rosellinia necatrix]|uniref:Putative serine family S28 n=1 Tax=Rosellinia necatrix TaxID=77044 RepID=A0A1S7UJ26_ROSNE|nr:putative serine family S28 [Rosellinia necatrix]